MRVVNGLMAIPSRLNKGLQQAWDRGDLIGLILALLLMLMPAFTLRAADWPLQSRILFPVILISITTSYLLAQSQYGELTALLLSMIYGGAAVLLVSAWSLRGLNLVAGSAEVITTVLQWVMDIFTGGINQDRLAFTVLVSGLFWFLSYNAVWHMFRLDRVWRVILPPAIVLLGNLAFYTGPSALEIYLAIFLFVSLLLLVRSNLIQREWSWYNSGVRIPKRLRPQFLMAGAGLSAMALAIAVLAPTGNLQDRLDQFQEFLRSDPIQQMAEFMNRLVEPIESEGPSTADYFGGDSLTLSGAISLGDQVILLADAPQTHRYYWRSRVFERYDGGRWAPSSTLRVPYLNPPVVLPLDTETLGGAREPVIQKITIGGTGSRLIYAAPQPVQITSVGGRVDLLRINEALDAASPVNISVMRPAKVLESGTTVEVVSQMSVATANQLRAAGTEYPDWVIDPSGTPGIGLSPRVANKALEIVNEVGAETPYDRAKAIETWLRNNITYNERIPAPPAGVDAVEWFLFEMKQGYCTYYATTMIVMLRSLGIPARMAAGFAQGEWDEASQLYIVRERDAHTWVEVYFPGYGWIEFEPTSAQEPLDREGDSAPPPIQNSRQELPTPTPQDSPTPFPSPTPQASPTPNPNQQQQDQPPTATLIPSVTPTATAVIVPTIAPPLKPPPPQSNDFLSFLFPALGAALLIFLLIVALVLIGLLLFWWWEWRGMGGLSPVSRAYARLERYISLIGIRHQDQETPEERRDVIVQKLPPAERPVTAITRLYGRERYGKPEDVESQEGRSSRIADNAWKETRRSIVQKWLRRFIPWRKDE